MSVLTVVELQAQVDTDLASDTLQDIIDSAERDITEYIGPATAYTVEYDPELLTVLRLPIGTTAIVSVVEFTGGESDPTKTTLSSDDYELSSDGWDLRRLSDGTNERVTWGWHVAIVLTPVADVARRKSVAVQLSRLEIIHTGYKTEKAGDWSATAQDLDKERRAILRRLGSTVLI